ILVYLSTEITNTDLLQDMKDHEKTGRVGHIILLATNLSHYPLHHVRQPGVSFQEKDIRFERAKRVDNGHESGSRLTRRTFHETLELLDVREPSQNAASFYHVTDESSL
ncbi:hypothetical protein V1478_016653, partial [Vespula squamosa]